MNPRTRSLLSLYQLIRYPLFQMDAERAHHVATAALKAALATRASRRLAGAVLEPHDPRLESNVWGIRFPNPVGLAAGFDKEGSLFNALAALGFGAVEIGTVTASAQPGNPRPRLFRLPADEALLNRMGFNNPGAESVARHLASSEIEPVLGINLGKSKVAELADATADYLRSLDLLQPYADYLVINVSSPNTPGLRSLQDAEPLRELVGAVVARVGALSGRGEMDPPVLVKLAPDLTDAQIEEAVEIAVGAGARGIIATNTTVARGGLRTPAAEVERLGAGGISGRPVRARALEVVSRIYRTTEGRVPIIGVGGIMSPDDAWERIRAGASLVQLYTGFVYGGPTVVRRINLGLARRLESAGFGAIGDAVGSAHR